MEVETTRHSPEVQHLSKDVSGRDGRIGNTRNRSSIEMWELKDFCSDLMPKTSVDKPLISIGGVV
jgi:hypothetical protein